MPRNDTRLPRALADRFTEPLGRFLKIEAAAGALLLIAALSALALANSPWSRSYLAFWETPLGVHFGAFDFGRSLRHWINDGLMTLFFFMVALELKRELVLGELRHLPAAALPFAGALGGMVVPVALYVALMDGAPGSHGWGTVMATDTAFVVGCLALFGSRIPASLRLFLLSLAIFDDVGAIAIVALAYGGTPDWLALALGMSGLLAVAALARLGIRNFPIYFLLGGLIWLGIDASGVHATLVGVVLGLMTPSRPWVTDARLHAILGRVLSYPRSEHWSGDTADRRDLRRAGTAASEALSPVERLEMMLHPWVGFAIMPLFALANAGVPLSGTDVLQPVPVAIVAGLFCGKPLGVWLFSWLAVRLRLATRPPDLDWPLVAGGSLLTGIGFTMSLFIAGLAFDPPVLDAAKLGILIASSISAVAGLLTLSWLAFARAPR